MGEGTAPAIGLVDPKFPHNVGAAVRAAGDFDEPDHMADAVGVTWGQ
jgi:hypothetical protein